MSLHTLKLRIKLLYLSYDLTILSGGWRPSRCSIWWHGWGPSKTNRQEKISGVAETQFFWVRSAKYFVLSIFLTPDIEQGTNDTFVFTNKPGHPVIFRPTGTYYCILAFTSNSSVISHRHLSLRLGFLCIQNGKQQATFVFSCLIDVVNIVITKKWNVW